MVFWTVLLAYLWPSAIMFVPTLSIVLVTTRKQPRLFSYDHLTWMLPGVAYAGAWELGLASLADGKSLSNLIEPGIVAVLAWVAFMVRVRIGGAGTASNRRASLVLIPVYVILGVAVLLLMPGLSG